MNQYFVYILLCGDNSYYTSVTNDFDRRIYEHDSGFDPKSYTFKRRPIKLVFYEMFTEVTQAILALHYSTISKKSRVSHPGLSTYGFRLTT